MRFLIASVALAAVASAASPYKSSAPSCVAKCWEYTKYVTLCQPDEGSQCLCDDSEYQSNVYQCLYSQCQTALLPNALHHTLAICATPNRNVENSHKPALLRQEVLKNIKRDAPDAPPSGAELQSVSAPLPQPSGARGKSGSVSGSAQRTWQTRGSAIYSNPPATATVGRALPTPGPEGPAGPVGGPTPPPAVTTPAVGAPAATPGKSSPLSGAAAVPTGNAAILAVAGGLALAVLA